MALLAFMLETVKEFLPSISHSQSRTDRTRLHGKILASFPATPRPLHCSPPHQARRRSIAGEVSAGCPAPCTAPPQSPISTPIPHNLKYRFWSLISLSVAFVRLHSGNWEQMINVRGILTAMLRLAADSVGAVQVG